MIKVTSDQELEKEIRAALKANDGYCPCIVKKTKDTKCMCKDFREMKEGTCFCGLYVKTLQ